MQKYALVVLLPETIPGRLDFVSREFNTFDDITLLMKEVDKAEPKWRAVSFCHIEDLPLMMDGPQ